VPTVNSKIAKVTLLSTVGLVALLGAWYGLLREAGTSGPRDCISEEMMTVPDVAGVRAGSHGMVCMQWVFRPC
jgi:hypothetical protein